MSQNYRFNLDPVTVPQVATKHRRIATAIPAPGTAEVMRRAFHRTIHVSPASYRRGFRGGH